MTSKCTGRKWQGCMIYVEGPKEAVDDVNQFLDNYGILFPRFKQESPKNLMAVHRIWRRKYPLYLDTDKEERVHAFQRWLDKQYGIAPDEHEAGAKVVDYEEVAKL